MDVPEYKNQYLRVKYSLMNAIWRLQIDIGETTGVKPNLPELFNLLFEVALRHIYEDEGITKG